MTLLQTENERLAHKPHILVVDDDNRIRDLVSRFLHENDFIALSAADAEEAKQLIERFEFDTLVVDVMMPGQNGLDFVRELRKQRTIPVLLLTALGEAADRITGLETGADDYLAKPFEPRELVLRLNAILRRTQTIPTESAVLRIGPWRYDPVHSELGKNGEIVRLTGVEGNLLRALAEKPGEPISREELAATCGLDAGERTIDVQVTRLRRKLEEDTKAPRYLQTVRGKGYLLRAEKL